MHPDMATRLVLGLAFATTASAFFRLPCKSPLVVERADPIVSPGEVSGHAHTIMGGNGFGFQMDYASTQASTCSSCTVLQDKSNYWVPTLYYKTQNGSFISVDQNGGATIYYLQRSDPADVNYPQLEAFPEGFRMLAGDPSLRSFNDTVQQNAVTFACLGTNTAQTNGFPSIKCPDGLRAQIFFPSCWNGVDLDSADHKSHVVYPSGTDHGSCPDGFPRRLVSIFYEVIWNTSDFDDMWYGDSQPFVLANGDPTGYGYHGDFVNGWDVPTLQSAVNNCTDASGVIELCPYFNFSTDNAAEACIIPPSIEEQVFGLMPKLPGCNPVQDGPSRALPQADCGAPTHIGQPKLPYVDFTKSKGFAYVGCGTDPAGKPRTLLGDQVNNQSGMTVEYCVDYCNSQGFSVAGLEYSFQCFCDNSIPSDRAADPSLVGGCAMPCSGDNTEICGGPSLISLYQKCGSSPCVNIDLPIINGSISTVLATQSLTTASASVSTSMAGASSSTSGASSILRTISSSDSAMTSSSEVPSFAIPASSDVAPTEIVPSTASTSFIQKSSTAGDPSTLITSVSRLSSGDRFAAGTPLATSSENIVIDTISQTVVPVQASGTLVSISANDFDLQKANTSTTKFTLVSSSHDQHIHSIHSTHSSHKPHTTRHHHHSHTQSMRSVASNGPKAAVTIQKIVTISACPT